MKKNYSFLFENSLDLLHFDLLRFDFRITSYNVCYTKLLRSYYSKDETIADVVDNFNIRRYYSAEGKSVTIDGTEVQVIIQQHSNPIHQSDVDKKILIPMDTTVYTGSYVVFEA